jgi:hypothetical protein
LFSSACIVHHKKQFFIMKKLLLCALLPLLAISAKATHLMGGDMTVQYDTNINHYVLKLTYYRDTAGIPMYQSENVEFFSWDPSNNVWVSDSMVTIPLDVTQSTSLLPNFPYGVEVGVYCDTINLPVGLYRFVSNTCCRNGAIINATNPLSESIIVHTDLLVDTGDNSSPGCLAMPVAYFPKNTAITYNPLPYDPDGDSIAWSLNTPIGSYSSTPSMTFTSVAGFTAPHAASSGPFTMNAVTGQISWTPDSLGNFIQSFIIDEYRNGTHIGSMIRDMQYIVVPPSTSPGGSSPMFVNVTPYQTNTALNYYYAYYDPGNLFQFQIQGMDANGTNLSMNAFSEIMHGQNPATFNVIGSGNNIIGNLSWMPPLNYKKDVIVVFRLGNGVFTQDFTLLLRKDPNPTNVQAITSGLSNLVVYPNPAKDQLHINLELQKEINSNICLYNAIGQKVATIYDGKLMKGNSSLSANLHLATGIYQLVVRDNGAIIKTVSVAIQ